MEEAEDPEFDVDFDTDMAVGGVDPNVDLVAPLELELVATSSKGKQPMEGTSRAAQPTHASITSTSIVIGGNVTEVTDEAEASLDTEPNDVYVAHDDDDDHVSSSGDEFDD